jgi:hypothetical protein
MTVKALKSPAYVLNKIRSQSMDFRTQHINQQSLMKVDTFGKPYLHIILTLVNG